MPPEDQSQIEYIDVMDFDEANLEAILAGSVKDGEEVRVTVSGGKLALNGREVVARAA